MTVDAKRAFSLVAVAALSNMFNMLTGSKGRYPGLKQNGYTEVRRLGKGAFGFALLVKRGTDGLFVAKLQKCADTLCPSNDLSEHNHIDALSSSQVQASQ